jgi:hypothetical protein
MQIIHTYGSLSKDFLSKAGMQEFSLLSPITTTAIDYQSIMN